MAHKFETAAGEGTGQGRICRIFKIYSPAAKNNEVGRNSNIPAAAMKHSPAVA